MLTIQELETEAGIPRRTIHFYIKEGLIPPPRGTRRNALYGDEHLLRLRLIQVLKEGSHLRLEGIREILDEMSVGEMRDQLVALESASIDPLDLVAHTLRPNPAADDMAMGSPLLSEEATPPEGESPNLMKLVDEEPARLTRPSSSFVGRLRTLLEQGGTEPNETESWQRVRVSEDVEIHYRDTKKKRRALKIEQAIAFAREILED
jgi:DNA-binding transcriptional MerR regulator